MSEKMDGCVKPAGGPVAAATAPPKSATPPETKGRAMQARVGHPAPDFEASAYQNGEFRNVKLSEYKGQWLVALLLSRRLHLRLTHRAGGGRRQS